MPPLVIIFSNFHQNQYSLIGHLQVSLPTTLDPAMSNVIHNYQSGSSMTGSNMNWY